MEPINKSHYPASRAAGVAIDYINYKQGGPHTLFAKEEVTSASKESIAGVGNKYQLTMIIKDFLDEQSPILCTAEVLYYCSAEHKPPKVTYTLQSEPQSHTATKDLAFYNRMKNLSEPLIAKHIPDKLGNVSTDMEPILHLAQAAASYPKWYHATEETFYRMTVIEEVKQIKRQDNALELEFIMLIHDMVSQEIIRWFIYTVWDPKGGLKIKNEYQLPKKNLDANN